MSKLIRIEIDDKKQFPVPYPRKKHPPKPSVHWKNAKTRIVQSQQEHPQWRPTRSAPYNSFPPPSSHLTLLDKSRNKYFTVTVEDPSNIEITTVLVGSWRCKCYIRLIRKKGEEETEKRKKNEKSPTTHTPGANVCMHARHADTRCTRAQFKRLLMRYQCRSQEAFRGLNTTSISLLDKRANWLTSVNEQYAAGPLFAPFASSSVTFRSRRDTQRPDGHCPYNITLNFL